MDFEIENNVLKGYEYNGNDEHVTVPDGVTEIGKLAFWGCENVKSISLPDSIKKIGDLAFYGCSQLTDVYIPDGIEVEIGKDAFKKSGVTNIMPEDNRQSGDEEQGGESGEAVETAGENSGFLFADDNGENSTPAESGTESENVQNENTGKKGKSIATVAILSLFLLAIVFSFGFSFFANEKNETYTDQAKDALSSWQDAKSTYEKASNDYYYNYYYSQDPSSPTLAETLNLYMQEAARSAYNDSRIKVSILVLLTSKWSSYSDTFKKAGIIISVAFVIVSAALFGFVKNNFKTMKNSKIVYPYIALVLLDMVCMFFTAKFGSDLLDKIIVSGSTENLNPDQFLPEIDISNISTDILLPAVLSLAATVVVYVLSIVIPAAKIKKADRNLK